MHFYRTDEGARDEAIFPHVPMSAEAGVDTTAILSANEEYRLLSLPFEVDMLSAAFEGRYMTQALVLATGR